MKYQKTFDDLPSTVQSVVRKIEKVAKPKSVILFGSRARGDHRENSDFDIVVVKKTCSESAWASLLVEIIEAPLTLFQLDVVEFEKLDEKYKENIRKEGKTLYE